MKSCLLFAFILCACSSAFSQIYRNQWLVGGSGSFSHTSSPQNFSSLYKRTDVTLNADAGFFIISHLAAGARFSCNYGRSRTIDTDTLYYKSTTVSPAISPFVRYYVLKPSSRINILADAAYNWYWVTVKAQYGTNHSHYKGYSFAAGPVWFITPSSALELTAGYSHTNDFFSDHDVTVNIGFHQHFGKAPRPKKS